MSHKFWWTAPVGGLPIVSIAAFGITFSSGAIEMLGRPEAILMGFDEENKALGIKPLHGRETEHPKAFAFMERLRRQNYIRIGCRDFVKVLSNRTGRDFSSTTRFAARWESTENLMIVDLTDPLDPVETDRDT